MILGHYRFCCEQYLDYRNVIRNSTKTDVILALDPAYCVTLKCRTMSVYSTRPEEFRFLEFKFESIYGNKENLQVYLRNCHMQCTLLLPL